MPKKKRGANQWAGYDEEEKRQYESQFEDLDDKTEKNTTKRDKGFYGKTHIQKRVLF